MEQFSIKNNPTHTASSTKTGLSPKKEAELKQACNMYESLYYKKMLEIAYKDIKVMGEGVGNKIYKDMYIDQLSQTSNGSIGISKILFDYLAQQQKGMVK
jgi:Rod binding domain-containing protein